MEIELRNSLPPGEITSRNCTWILIDERAYVVIMRGKPRLDTWRWVSGMWYLVSYSTSLCLNFLIYKMGNVITMPVLLTSWGCWEDQKYQCIWTCQKTVKCKANVKAFLSLLFGKNCKLTKSCKTKNRTKNIYIHCTQIYLLFTVYPIYFMMYFLSHTHSYICLYIIFSWTLW